MNEGGEAKADGDEVKEEENPWANVEKDEWGCPKDPTGNPETDAEIE